MEFFEKNMIRGDGSFFILLFFLHSMDRKAPEMVQAATFFVFLFGK
jgi:hypothetical protein